MTGAAAPRQCRAAVIENVCIARDTYRIRLADACLAGSILPGQFVMVRPVSGTDPLLGRPFALYDVVRDGDGVLRAIDLVYIVLGRGTAELARRRAGDEVTVWGPLGHGFGPPPDAGTALFVAGGIGQTPFLALARWWLGAVGFGPDNRRFESRPGVSARLIYGVRTQALLAGVADFEAAGVAVEIATDDGSAGHHGFVTDLLLRRLERGERPSKVVGCGPPPMLAALAKIAERHGLDCDLSLENHMACGFGACFSCVAPIRQPDGGIDLKRVCVEGPVFPARDVVLDGSH